MADIFSIESSQALLAFVLGGVLFASGASLIAIVVRQFLKERAQTPDSLLAPVLAVDTLAPTLRIKWVKSMLLEAEASDDVAPHSGRLAREIRRCLVASQAARRADRQTDAQILEAAATQALEDGLHQMRSGLRIDFDAMRANLAQTRTALDESSRAAEPDVSD
jgi:hypothetical protein